MAKGLGSGELRIGIAGLGTVGVGVLRLLTKNQAEISVFGTILTREYNLGRWHWTSTVCVARPLVG